ncbi:unnamed protein product, partial [Bubo scandiacus]
MGPGGTGSGWPLAGTVLVAVAASLAAGGDDCLWYVDRNGSWHPGFDCDFFTFCCGTCHQRYCCRDPLRLLTERQQRHCLAFSPKTIAGIASAVVLFIAIVTTIVCCFMCSCCYLYQRRQHLRTPCKVGAGVRGPEIPLSSYPPAAPPAPFPMDPKAGPMPPSPASPPWPCTRRPAPPPSTRCTPLAPPSTTPQRLHPTSRHSPATPES